MRRAAVGAAPRGLAEGAREARRRQEGEGGGAEDGGGGEAPPGGGGLRREAGGGQAAVHEVAGAPQEPHPRKGGEERQLEERKRKVRTALFIRNVLLWFSLKSCDGLLVQ